MCHIKDSSDGKEIIMSSKRKDSKGRVLKTGESERQDGRYQYRFTDNNGKRHTVYANDLKALREKESELAYIEYQNLDYNAGKTNVVDLVERFLRLKQNAAIHTQQNYKSVVNNLIKDPFGKMLIGRVNKSDAQLWCVKQYETGKKYNTIAVAYSVLSQSFQMAHDDGAISKNPFSFKLSSVIKPTKITRCDISYEEEQRLLNFIKDHKRFYRYYDVCVVLLNTGLRINECCALTQDDIDLEGKMIHVTKQFVVSNTNQYHIVPPKTNKGIRNIPINQAAYQSLSRMIEQSKRIVTQQSVDGYTGFIILTDQGKPKVAQHIERGLRNAIDEYNKLYPENPLPKITPHVMRHTFCTRLVKSGVDLKVVQYLMGHSDINVTMNIYTHVNMDWVVNEVNRVFEPSPTQRRDTNFDTITS